MKKRICLLLAILLVITGCGKIPTLENGQEAVVTFENGDKISVDDLYEKVKDTYALNTLITMIDKYVLEKTFDDYKDTAKGYAESYYKALEENYGGADKLLQALNQSGIATAEAYKEIMYLNYMQSHAAEEYAKAQITDKEIEKYYKDEVVGDIEISHILITPNVTDKMKDAEIKEAEKKAKEEAEAILKKLKDVKKENFAEEFKKLAKENSDDAATKTKGGALGKINKDTLSKNYDELVKAAYELKDGAYSTKVVTTELGYHIIYRTKSYDKPTLKDSKEKILTTLSTKLLQDDQTLYVDSLTHYRKELGMEIIDSELQTQYAYSIQNQIAQIEANKNSGNK